MKATRGAWRLPPESPPADRHLVPAPSIPPDHEFGVDTGGEWDRRRIAKPGLFRPVTLVELPQPAFDGASPEKTRPIYQTTWAALIGSPAEGALGDWEDNAQVSFRQEWFNFCVHSKEFIGLFGLTRRFVAQIGEWWQKTFE